MLNKTRLCYLIVLSVLVSTLALTGCRSLPSQHTPSAQLDERQSSQTRGTFQSDQKLVLPDGRIITDDANQTPVEWDNLVIQLWMMGVEKTNPETVIGNDTEIVSKRQVSIPLGLASLVLVKRTPSSAEQIKSGNTSKSTLEYWLMTFRPYPQREDMNLAYVIHAEFDGDQQHAESELLSIAKGWIIP